MASYEESAGAVIDQITTGMAGTGVSSATISAIESLIPQDQPDAQVTISEYVAGQVDPNATIVTVADGTNLTNDPGGKAIIMDAATSANVVFSDNSSVEAIVVGGGGNSNVVFEGARDATVQLMGGHGDNVATGGGNDNIAFNGGSATINTGEGDDVVNVQGEGNVAISGGSGNMKVLLRSDSAQATIDAGDGFDEVGWHDFREHHTIRFENGQFVMHSDQPVYMTNVNVVTYDGQGDGLDANDQITVLASNQQDSLVAKLYQVAFGREAIDSPTGDANWAGALGGLDFWMNQFENQTGDHSIEHLYKSFLNCDEFHGRYDGMSNADYVAALFNNLAEVDQTALTQIAGRTAAEFVAALDNNSMARDQVAYEIANSSEATQILGVDGVQYVIDGFTA